MQAPLRQSDESSIQSAGTIEKNLKETKASLEENIDLKKDLSEIPEAGMAVLYQQYHLVKALEEWLDSLKRMMK